MAFEKIALNRRTVDFILSVQAPWHRQWIGSLWYGETSCGLGKDVEFVLAKERLYSIGDEEQYRSK